MKSKLISFQNKWLAKADILVILIFCCTPLLLSFPYRVNIFLSWEGAYRLSIGEIPYKDFGLPLGFAYWVVPAVFFKIFGPYFLSLVKSQVLLNLICCFSMRGVLNKFKVGDGLRFALMLVFCLSYILVNFWPWYNNSVIIYEITGLNFLLIFLKKEINQNIYFYFLPAFFYSGVFLQNRMAAF